MDRWKVGIVSLFGVACVPAPIEGIATGDEAAAAMAEESDGSDRGAGESTTTAANDDDGARRGGGEDAPSDSSPMATTESPTTGDPVDDAGTISGSASEAGGSSTTSDSSAESSSGPSDEGSSEDDGAVEPPPDLSQIGCADGEREAFVDLDAFPDIAGCDGGWNIAGVLAPMVACGRLGGDDGVNAIGLGCAIEDLCAPGWHVCRGADDVDVSSPIGCAGVAGDEDSLFYATRQSGPGGADCGEGTNDLFGCGTLGFPVNPGSGCGPLTQLVSADACQSTAGLWDCDDAGTAEEALAVVKLGLGSGGALCCAD